MRGVRTQRSALNPAAAADGLTATMARCLAKLREKGGLIRLPGGYWVSPSSGFVDGKPGEPWDIQSTIDGLIRRGLAVASVTKRAPGGASYATAVKPTRKA